MKGRAAQAVAIPAPAAAAVAVGSDPDILARIAEPAVALVVWARANPCPQAVEPAAQIDEMVPAGASAADIAALLMAAGYGAAVPALAADIARLLAVVADLGAARRLRFRLDRLTGDGCRLFHADYVTWRLLTTYAGPGTEWRAAPEGPIERLRPGDVAVLKGRLLLDPPTILHRSPPIAGTGTARVVLAIDPVETRSPPIATVPSS